MRGPGDGSSLAEMGRGGSDTQAQAVASRLSAMEQGYPIDTRRAILDIRSLEDDILLTIAKDETFSSPEHKVTHQAPGKSTNPVWIQGRCAEEAYERDLVDEQELDRLTR